MSLTIQERLKDLRVERGLTLKELAEQTGLSSSALGSYESDDTKDISHYALIKLAKFYGVTADYLLGLSEMKNHPDADLADLRLSDNMIDALKEGRVDTALLGELVTHPDFMKLLSDISIYVSGIAAMQIHNLNAWVATEIKTAKTRIVIDMGDELSLDSDFQPKPLSISGVTDEKSSCDAVFFIGDHVGQIRDIRSDIPLYMGSFAKEVLLAAIRDAEQATIDKIQTANSFVPGKQIAIGDMCVTPFSIWQTIKYFPPIQFTLDSRTLSLKN